MDFFWQILEGNGHKRTQREGLCTGTAKSELRYDIYLEQIAVYQYIGISLQPYYFTNFSLLCQGSLVHKSIFFLTSMYLPIRCMAKIGIVTL